MLVWAFFRQSRQSRNHLAFWYLRDKPYTEGIGESNERLTPLFEPLYRQTSQPENHLASRKLHKHPSRGIDELGPKSQNVFRLNFSLRQPHPPQEITKVSIIRAWRRTNIAYDAAVERPCYKANIIPTGDGMAEYGRRVTSDDHEKKKRRCTPKLINHASTLSGKSCILTYTKVTLEGIGDAYVIVVNTPYKLQLTNRTFEPTYQRARYFSEFGRCPARAAPSQHLFGQLREYEKHLAFWWVWKWAYRKERDGAKLEIYALFRQS